MRIFLGSILVAHVMAGVGAAEAQVRHAGLERMPASLETRFALSALPASMRQAATVYLLDVQHGYFIAQRGTSGIACLVQRTAWEQADFRDDIYVPRCYDGAGSRSYLHVLIDAAALRAAGMKPAALKTEIEARYKKHRYSVPDRAGLSYMEAPLMRTWGPDGITVSMVSGPHVMFYAPGVTGADIGALPNGSKSDPFIVEEGVPEQSFIIQLAARLNGRESSRRRSNSSPTSAPIVMYFVCVHGPRNNDQAHQSSTRSP